MAVIWEESYGINGALVEEYRCKNRDINICQHGKCKKFKPELPAQHCPYAATTYQLSRIVGIVLVAKCSLFEEID